MTKKRRVRVYKKGGDLKNLNQFIPEQKKGGQPCFECGGGVYEDGGELDMYQNQGEVSYDELKAYHEKMRLAVGINDIETLNANGSNGKKYSRSDLAGTWHDLQEARKAANFPFWKNYKEEASTIFPHVGQQIRGTFNEIAGTHWQEGGPLEQEQEQPMSLYDDKKQQFINILQEEVSEHQEEQTYNSLLEEAENMPYQFAREGGQQWMQKASDSMKKRGTVGSFTKYCGGKVTLECIKKGLNSNSKAINKKAAFAKASWKVAGKMQMGGYTPMHQKPPGEINSNPWRTPGSKHPIDNRFTHSTKPGSTRWITEDGKTPFQELLNTPKFEGGYWSGEDTLIHNDPRRFSIEDGKDFWGAAISRDINEQQRIDAFQKTYGNIRSLLGNNPDPIDEKYYNAVTNTYNRNPVSEEDEKEFRFYSKAKKSGGDIPMHQDPPGQIQPRGIAPISTEANQVFTGDSNASNNQVSDLINRHMNYVKPPQTFTEYLDVFNEESKDKNNKSKGQLINFDRPVSTRFDKGGESDDDNWFDKWNKATDYEPSWNYTDQNIDLLQPSKPEYEGLDYGIDYQNIDADRNSFTSDYTKNYYDAAGDTGGGGDQFSSFNDQESGIAGTPNYNPKLDFNSKEYDIDYQSKVSVGTDEGVLSGTGDPNNKSRLRMFGEGLGKKALLNPVAATELFANFTKRNDYKQKRAAGMTDNLVADMQYRGALGKRESDDQGALGYGINPNTGKQWELSTGVDSEGQFNASVGQKGMQVGDVQEMSPEQIEEFISMGGQIEFLD